MTLLTTKGLSEPVTVVWDANNENDLAGYYIYVGETSRNYTGVVDVGNQTEFTWVNLTDGNTYYFAVTAYDYAGNESAFSDEVNFTLNPGGDNNSPELVAINVMGETQLDIVFSENMAAATAENTANYTISDNVSVLGAVLGDDQKTVHLVTSAHTLGESYVLTLNNITDANGTAIPAGTARSYDMPEPPDDSAPPTLLSLYIMGDTQIDLVFSEPLELASSQNTANYSISNGVQVIAAALDDNQTTVHLVTTAHQLGQSYQITVNGIADLDGNTIASSVRNYEMPGPADDTVPPILTRIDVIDDTHIEVTFSEPVEEQSAQQAGNYSIDNGVQVSAATLNSNLTTVTLLTTMHVNGNYTLTVNNVRDRAPVPNTILNDSRFGYIVDIDQGGIGSTDNTPPSVTSVIVNGATQLDVHFSEQIEETSAEQKDNYIITPSVDIVGAILNENGTTVHLITAAHAAENDYTLIVNNILDQAQNPNEIPDNTEFSYTYAKEDVEFPGEDQQPEDGGGAQTPRSFALFQNYPNPFNPETEIRFYLDKRRPVNLAIYNTLGQLIKVLAQDEMPQGYHTVVWDGSNEQGRLAPSGVYFYSLEVNKEDQRGSLLVDVSIERRVKRMTLLR
jgi:fibronectin type 3 domain-containing protein